MLKNKINFKDSQFFFTIFCCLKEIAFENFLSVQFEGHLVSVNISPRK
jgi:hypothetical protein